MRSCPFENEERGFNSVDEEPVRLDMTFTMVVPYAGERMVAVLGGQWHLSLKMVNVSSSVSISEPRFLESLRSLRKRLVVLRSSKT